MVIVKLRLEQKFLRYVLYTRRNAIGIGLIKPNTAITVLTMKLFIGNKRAKTKISQMIKIIDKMVMIKNR